jgi:hypothetical protein
MNTEGYAFFWWDRQTGYTCQNQPCASCTEIWKEVHRVVPAPVKRIKLGWFIPNSAALIQTMRNAIADGKRVTVDVLPNGPVEFFAEDK